MLRRLLPFSLLLVFTLVPLALAPAVVLADTIAEPHIQLHRCYFPVPEGEIQGETITCGTLITPLNRADPDGASVELAFAIVHSHAASPRPDPIFYLEGGPGGGAVMFAEWWMRSPLRDERDIVLLDQRGTGYSQPRLTCPETGRVNWGDENSYINALDECAQRLVREGADIAHFNTRSNANDVADLAEALGYTQYNLYGVSYGTRLALTIMRDYPQGLRSVVLDSTYPPPADIYEEGPINSYRVFSQMFDDCAADAACASTYPDLESRFFKLVDRLNVTPIELDGWFSYEMTGDDLIDEMFQLFYVTDVLPYLPRMVDELTRDDTTTLDGLLSGSLPEQSRSDDGFRFPDYYTTGYDDVDEFRRLFRLARETLDEDQDRALFAALADIDAETDDALIAVFAVYFNRLDVSRLTDILALLDAEELARAYDVMWWRDDGTAQSMGLYLSIICQDEMPFNDIERARSSAQENHVPVHLYLPELEQMQRMNDACTVWTQQAAPDIEMAPVYSDIPTLVLAGAYDPITPPRWGMMAAESLSISYVYEFPGSGHGLLAHEGCPLNLTMAFLDRPGTAPADACIDQMTIDFDTTTGSSSEARRDDNSSGGLTCLLTVSADHPIPVHNAPDGQAPVVDEMAGGTTVRAVASINAHDHLWYRLNDGGYVRDDQVTVNDIAVCAGLPNG